MNYQNVGSIIEKEDIVYNRLFEFSDEDSFYANSMSID